MKDKLTIKRKYDTIEFKKLVDGMLMSYEDRVIVLNDDDIAKLKEYLNDNSRT